MQMKGGKQAILVSIMIGRGMDERLFLQIFNREGICVSQWMILRKPGNQLVLEYRNPVEVGGFRVGTEAAVYGAFVAASGTFPGCLPSCMRTVTPG